jgi:copper chaperone CopZ
MRIASFVGPALALVLALTGCESAPSKSSGARTTDPAAAAATPGGATGSSALAAGAAAPAGDHAMCGGSCGGSSCGGACGASCAMGMTTAAAEAPAATAVPADAQWTLMHVTGMHCGMCAKRVKAALAQVDGVLGVEVDVGKGEVKVATAKGADARTLASAPINGLGFQVQTN